MKRTTIQLFSPTGIATYENVKSWDLYGDQIRFKIADVTYCSTLKFLVIEDEIPASQN